jgi:hypothetical protein
MTYMLPNGKTFASYIEYLKIDDYMQNVQKIIQKPEIFLSKY